MKVFSKAAVTGAATGIAISMASAAAAEPIKIGWTAWSDAEAVTKMAQQIIEERLDQEVELVMADIGIQYQGLANDDLDFMMMAWLPDTHDDYYENVAGEVVDLGPIYTYARLGWAVPTYVDESIQSIEDLKSDAARDMFGGQIQGIDPGAGLMRLSDEAIEAYGLDYELVSSSGAGMTAALERAVRRDEPIVVTTWSPHWMFGKWDLRYLDDPQGALGGLERIHVVTRKDFYRDYPEVASFLSRFFIDIDELQAVMFEASETSYEEAVAKYIADNPTLVDYWATGAID